MTFHPTNPTISPEARVAELERELSELRTQLGHRSPPSDLFAMHRLVLESMTEGVTVASADGFILYTNPAQDRMFGYQPGELLGQHVSVQNALGPEETTRRLAAIQAALDTTGVWVGESLNKKKDGTTFYTRARMTILDLGGAKHWLCVQEDTTERTHAALQLARVQQQLRHVVDSSAFGIALWNPAGELIQANQTLLRILDRSLEQIPREPFPWESVTPAVFHHSDRAGLEQLHRDGCIAPFEKEFLRPDGSRVPVLVAAALLPAPGGVVSYVVDISEQKRAEQEFRTSEERLRLAQQAARIGSWSLNLLHPDENFWSEETYALAGMDRSWKPVYAGWLAHVHPDDRERVDHTITQSLAEGDGEFVITYRFRGTDLVERWHESRGRVQRDSSGNAVAANGITLDITERKRTEGARQSVERQLLLLVEASSSLLASPHSSDVLRTIVELAQRFISASAYAVWRKHDDDLWRLSCSSGLSEDYVLSGAVGSNGVPSLPTSPLVFEDITKESFLEGRQQALVREGIRSMLVMPLHINGQATGTVVFYWKTKRKFSGAEVRIASALGNLAASALGTAELYDRQLRLRAQAEASESRAAFLAEAGAVLASSLDYQATLSSVAQLAVPSFADSVTVDVLDEQGELQRVAIHHVDPHKALLALEFRKRYPPGENESTRMALGAGKSLLMEDLPDHLIAARVSDPEKARMIRQLGVKSFIIAPMLLGDRSLGMITFATSESGRRYNAADLQTAEELARRAAAAIDHARLYQNVRHSEERYRSLISATTSIVWTVDPKGRFTQPQQSWEAHTGQTWKQHKGLRWLHAIHPDDRQGIQEAWVRSCTQQRPYESEGRLWHALSHEYRHFIARAAAVRNADGSVREWVGTITDVHQRKQAEEERVQLLLREKQARQTAELLNQVGPVLLSELNAERLIQSITDIATMLTGAQFGALFQNSRDEAGEPFLLYTLSGASRAEFEKFPMLRHTQVFAPTFHDKQVVRSDNILNDPRYGHNAPFHGMPAGHLPVQSYLAVPVVSRSGEVFGALIFGHASPAVFTEQHEHIVRGIAAQAAIAVDNARLFAESQRAQLTLERTNEDLRRANEDLNQFAYSASHDLREPLRMVAIYSQMLQRRYRDKLDEEANEYFGYAIEGAKRMEMLVADLLAYTQAVNIGDLQRLSPVSADGVLDETLANLKGVFAESAATLRRGPLPKLLVAECHLLQLFQNLIGNAIKYRGEKPPEIAIESERAGEMWRICIHDNGIGIAPEYAEQVFGIFKRLHNSERYSGTGIGLAICQKICERYGGRIWVRSPGEGRGSTFCFTLPGVHEDG